MGGVLPLGYDARERKLVVNRDEAETVRGIFERYLELGSVRLLGNDLRQRGIVSSARVSRNGNARGDKQFSRGALDHLVYWRASLQRRGELGASARSHPGRARPQSSRMRRAQMPGAKPGRSTEPPRTGELGLKCKVGLQLRQR